MIARPDPATFQILPEPDGRPADSARMFCDLQMPDGPLRGPILVTLLRRALSNGAERGFTSTPSEIEFFLLKDRPTDAASPSRSTTVVYFDMTSHDSAHNFRRDAMAHLKPGHLDRVQPTMRWPPAQQEIDCATPTRSRWPTTS